MKRFNLIAVSLVFIALFAVSSFAQTAQAGKIGLLNTYAFGDEKEGIGKFKSALAALEVEFKQVNDKLKALGTRYQALGTEIEEMRKAASGTTAGVPKAKPSQEVVQAKIDELQSLETQIKREQEDAKAKYERRYQQVVGPVFNDIMTVLSEYTKTKGYAAILDGAKLAESDILLGFDPQYDVTKDFIAFYNGRQTATAAKPK